MKKRVYPKRSRKVVQVRYFFENGVFYLTLCEFHGRALCEYKVPVSQSLSYRVFCYDRCGDQTHKRDYEFFVHYARRYGDFSRVVVFSVAK